jgi:hypothetical protein
MLDCTCSHFTSRACCSRHCSVQLRAACSCAHAPDVEKPRERPSERRHRSAVAVGRTLRRERLVHRSGFQRTLRRAKIGLRSASGRALRRVRIVHRSCAHDAHLRRVRIGRRSVSQGAHRFGRRSAYRRIAPLVRPAPLRLRPALSNGLAACLLSSLTYNSFALLFHLRQALRCPCHDGVDERAHLRR